MKWVRRSIWAASALVLLMLLAWLTLPGAIRSQAEQRLGDLLGRTVTIADVSFNPWTLEVTARDLTIAGMRPDRPLLSVSRLYANLQLSSLWKRAPVLQAIDIEAPRVSVARTAPGHYDIDDVLAKLAPRADTPTSDPARYALANLRVIDGAATFDDQPAARTHQLKKLNLSLPFLSALPADVAVEIEPRLAFELNGAAFDTGAHATPFAANRQSNVRLQLGSGQPGGEIDLRPYLGYVPVALPVQIERGKLGGQLAFAYAVRDGRPSLGITGELAMSDFALIARDRRPLLSGRRLTLPLKDVQPLAARMQLGAIRLDGAQLMLRRDEGGQLNVALLATPQAPSRAASAPARGQRPASAASAAASAPSSWSASVDSVTIADSRIQWKDATTTPAAELVIEGLNVGTQRIVWPLAAPIALEASAKFGSAAASERASLNLKGDAAEAAARIDWRLDAAPLAMLAPYVAQGLSPQIAGKLSAQGKVDWAAGRDARTRVTVAQGQINELQLNVAASAALTASAPQRSLRDPSRPRGREQPVSLQQLNVTGADVDLQTRTVRIAGIDLKKPSLWLSRAFDGRWNAQSWLTSSTESTPRPSDTAASTPGWQVFVQDLKLADGRFRLVDQRPRAGEPEGLRPVRLRLSDIQLAMQGFQWSAAASKPAAPAKIKFDAVFGRTAQAEGEDPSARGAQVPRLEWTGELALDPLLIRGNATLRRVPVEAFERYIDNPLRIDLARADLGYRGDFSVQSLPAGWSANVAGDVRLSDFSLLALPGTLQAPATPAAGVSEAAARAGPTSPDELVRWRRLALDGFKFAMVPGGRPQVDIAQARIDDFYSRLVVTEQGRINVLDATRERDDAPVESSKPAAAPAPSRGASAVGTMAAVEAPPAIDVRLGGTKLVNGRIDFADRFVKPNYSAALTDLNGSFGAVQSGSREMAEIELRGRAEGSALLEITGRLNPFADPLALDIRAKANDLELAPLSPYAAKYAGYAIERGKLSMNVHYRIDPEGRLEADNQVILNQLTFGERIESPQATTLPVRLAVALLKDSRGVIDLNLPISGSLKDPQFSIAALLGRVIGNVLLKALTSPFALLSGLGSGDGGDTSQISFAPGSAALAPDQHAALDKVAQALKERGGLTLTLTGQSDIDREREAYRATLLRQRLATEAQREDRRAARAAQRAASAASGASPAASMPLPATSAAPLDPATRERLLNVLYTRTELPDKPRNFIGLNKALPPSEMERRLLDAIEVTPESMRELANQRALAVRDALIAQGLPSDRLFLAAPKTDASNAPPTPPVATSVADAASAAMPARVEGNAWQPRVRMSLQAN